MRARKTFIIIFTLIINTTALAQAIPRSFVVKFPEFSTKLSAPAKATIKQIASAMRSHPEWNYSVATTFICRDMNVLIWQRVNNLIREFVNIYGIRSERFLLSYNDSLSAAEVFFLPTLDSISVRQTALHPNLRKLHH